MKTSYKVLLSIFIIIFISSCLENKPIKQEVGPEIYITHPSAIDTFRSQTPIRIGAVIGGINGVHDVSIYISGNESKLNHDTMFFDHIHEDSFEVDTSIVAEFFDEGVKSFQIRIVAVDMLGNSNTDSTSFLVYRKN